MGDDTWSDLPPIPPYLFRAASDQSRGKNTAEEIDPLHGYNRDYHANLTELELETPNASTAEWMIRNHVEYKYVVPSEFSSWSISLLWVLVHAVRKLYSLNETNVLIYIMDTSKLHPTRIHNAHHLLKKYKSKCTQESQRYTETHEYLIHGRLWKYKKLWRAVTLETLITAGLWKGFIELGDAEGCHRLNSQVWQLRYPDKREIDRPPWPGYWTQVYDITPAYLRIISDIAECFGREWKGTIVIALLAIKKRELTLSTIKALAHDLAELEIKIPQLPWRSDLSLQVFSLGVRDVPEAWQFLEMLRWLRARQRFLEKSGQEATASVMEGGEVILEIRPAGLGGDNTGKNKLMDEEDKENSDPLLLVTPPATSGTFC